MQLNIKILILVCMLVVGYCHHLSAQVTVNIEPREANIKVWGNRENVYIQTDCPYENSGFWGYVSKNDKIKFYKITGTDQVKELVFDVLQPYVTHKEEMKKQFFYFGHYVLLIIQTDAILFDLENETHQVIIEKDPLFLSDTWYQVYFDEAGNNFTLIATNGSMKIFNYDLAEGELTNEEVELDGIKLKRPEVIDKNKVVCRYEVDKTVGWLVMDMDTKEAEQIVIPDAFPKFRSCEFYRIPGSEDIYMEIIGELTSSFYSKVKTFIYNVNLNVKLLEKKIETDLFFYGVGLIRLENWTLLGVCVDGETKVLLYTQGEFKIVPSAIVDPTHCFYHEGEFYCYRDLSKSNTSKPKLYKLDNNEYVWKEERTLTEKREIKPYLFYVNGKPRSIFIENVKGEQTIHFTPPVF